MDGLNNVSRAPMTLLPFNRQEHGQDYSVGVDKDIGGSSSAHLDFEPKKSSEPNNRDGSFKFWGEMRLGVRSELRGRVRGGYAGFRSKVSPIVLSYQCKRSIFFC